MTRDEAFMLSGADSDSPTGTRSLIPMTAERPAGTPPALLHAPRPSAVFVAQLIAMAQRVPQSRRRRRAEPAAAAASYAAAAPQAQPHRLERVM